MSRYRLPPPSARRSRASKSTATGGGRSTCAGGHLAQVDLLYKKERIAIFYDGGHHDVDPVQNARDRSKARELTLEGYLVLRYDKRQLFRFPHHILNDVANALELRRRR